MHFKHCPSSSHPQGYRRGSCAAWREFQELETYLALNTQFNVPEGVLYKLRDLLLVSDLLLEIALSFFLLALSFSMTFLSAILLDLNCAQSFPMPSLLASIIAIVSSSPQTHLTILISLACSVHLLWCMQSRLAALRVSTPCCSVAQRRARIAILVILKFPQSVKLSLTNLGNGAKGRIGSTLVCHFLISWRVARGLGFFFCGGSQSWAARFMRNSGWGHFLAAVGGGGQLL